MITPEDYFRKMPEEPPEAVKANAAILLARVNALLAEIDLPDAITPIVNSGWRTEAHNAQVPNAAPRSKHITGEAIDLADPEGDLDAFLTSHTRLLIEHELWMEHPLATKGWTHLQCVAPKSGNLVFYP